jgi:long-chain acyl-CoA synthetase
MNLARQFIETADRLPDKPFLVDATGIPHSYVSVLSRARRFTSFLDSNRVGPGDRVILTFPNCVDLISAYLGSLFRSCTVVMADFRSPPGRLDSMRTDCDASLLVSPEERIEHEQLLRRLPFPRELASFPETPVGRLCEDDNPLALIMYTSGTTGIPKGVCLSHANLSWTVRSIASWASIDEGDRELTTLSLTHLFGLAHVHIYWTLGGTIFLDTLQDIPALLQRISRDGITSFPGTPGGFRLILDNFVDDFRRHARSLKYIIVDSAPMAPEYVKLILDSLPGTRMFMYYGLTEASRSSYICYNDHPTKIETVGRPAPGAEICVGSPFAPLTDAEGEILIRGPHVTQGYWGIDSTPYFDQGWFKSGDLGVLDQDGFLTWTGRVKEQINIDGFKLTPTEVETVLGEHPRVKDCAVVGVPDKLTGESVIAFVVTDGAGDKQLELALRRFCKSRLEIHKIPKRILFVDEIPRTDSGKPKRVYLKERLEL